MSVCLNCGKETTQTEGKRPRKTCSDGCRQKLWVKEQQVKKAELKGAKMIELPADFINCEKIGIIRADGTIEELKDFDQLPEPFKLAAKGIWELNTDVTHFKPQEPTKTKKEEKATQKEEAAVNGAENALWEPVGNFFEQFSKLGEVDTANPNAARIAKIEADLKLPFKYLPKHKRNELTKELNELKNKL